MTTYKEKLKQIQNVFQENGFSPDLFSRIYERMSSQLNQPFMEMSVQQVQERLTDYCNLFSKYDIKTSETEHIFKRFPRLFFNNPSTVHQNIQSLAKALNKTEYEIVQRIKFHPETFLLKTERLERNAKETSKIIGIPLNKYIDIALSQTQLLHLSPETLKQRICETSQVLNMSEATYKKILQRAPQIVWVKPETVVSNMNKFCEMFDIKQDDFIKSALRYPNLFYSKPETMIDNCLKNAQALDIPKEKYIQMALKQPTLMACKSETLLANVQKNTELLNISANDFIKACTYQPQLLFLKPESIDVTVTQSAKLLKVAKEDFVQAALKGPILFYAKPQTIYKKYNLYRQMHKNGFIVLNNENTEEDLKKRLLSSPTLFGYSMENFHLRCAYARYLIRQKKSPETKSLTATKGAIKKELAKDKHYKPLKRYNQR